MPDLKRFERWETVTVLLLIASIGQLWFHSEPSSALVSPSTDATERSISAATMIIVSGSAMSAISATSERIELRFWPDRNPSAVAAP